MRTLVVVVSALVSFVAPALAQSDRPQIVGQWIGGGSESKGCESVCDRWKLKPVSLGGGAGRGSTYLCAATPANAPSGPGMRGGTVIGENQGTGLSCSMGGGSPGEVIANKTYSCLCLIAEIPPP